MKKTYLTILFTLLTFLIFAQAPQGLSYQSIIKGADGTVLSAKSVGVQISILQGSETGTVVYSETHTISTNANGLISLEIGAGTTTDVFSNINWATNTYFLKSETDPEGGSDYTISGVSQILSVPYALHAKTVENNDDADADASNEIQNLSLSDGSLSISNGNSVELPSSYPKLQISDTLNVGSNGMNIMEIVELTGTTDATNQYALFDLPTGYTTSNCYVLSLQIYYSFIAFSSQYYGLGHVGADGTVGYQLNYSFGLVPGTKTTNKVRIDYPSILINKPFKLVLMKVK